MSGRAYRLQVSYLDAAGAVKDTPSVPLPISNWLTRDEFKTWAQISTTLQNDVVDGAMESAATFLEEKGCFLRAARVKVRYDFTDIHHEKSSYTNGYSAFVFNRIAPITQLISVADRASLSPETNVTYEQTNFPYVFFQNAHGYIDVEYQVGTLQPASPVAANEASGISSSRRELLKRLFTSFFFKRDAFTDDKQTLAPLFAALLRQVIPNI